MRHRYTRSVLYQEISVCVLLVACLLRGAVCQDSEPGRQAQLVTTTDCGTKKGCIHFPIGCASPACDAILTWSPSTDRLMVDFELMAFTDGWVAVGLSTDTLMTNDSVVYCLTNHSVGLGYIPMQQYVEYIADDQTVLTGVTSAYVNGQIHCKFTRPTVVSTGLGKIFSLNQKYYLLLGLGPLDITSGLIAKHRKDPFVSAQAIDVTEDIFDITHVTRPPSSPGAAALPTERPNTGKFQLHNNKAKITYVAQGNTVSFQLWGPTGSAWVAAGFSHDQLMGDDCVIACSVSSSGVVVKHWFNNIGRFTQPVANATDGITVELSSIINGAIYCQFKRTIKLTVGGQSCDLNTLYYLLLGYGPTAANGDIAKHVVTPDISTEHIDVTTSTESLQASGKSIDILKAHACLMITAWILLVSPSIILARYFKTAFPGDKICGTAVWFAVHRFLMLLALTCTLVGFIIIFIYVGYTGGKMATFNDGYPGYFWVHGPLGIIVMILVIINPLVAAVRCGPDSKYRPIFNWIHWIIGTSCYIIAMITIFFGAKMGEAPDSNLHISHIAIFWILIAFTAYHCLTEIALIIHKFMEEDLLKRKVYINQEYELTSSGAGHSKHKPKADEATVAGLIFRYVLLGLYGIVTLGLWLAMIILIGSGNVG